VTRVLSVEPEAQNEILEAARWYEKRSPGLGVELTFELDTVLERVLEGPQTFPIVAALGLPRVRRALLRRFPYAVIFVESRDRVDVIAFAHGRRKPMYWAARARD
jgi:plasmid stabilization system protein ParE